MNAAARTLLGIAATVTATYFLDPASGRRRRARVADQITSLAVDLQDSVAVAARDLSYRFRGVAAKTRGRMRPDQPGDDVLTERVRAALGRVVSHPRAVHVEVHDGHVILSGDVLAHEHQQLIQTVQSVRGTRGITDQLAIHQNANGIPALQGGRPRMPRQFPLLRENWSPAMRLVAGGIGGLLLASAVRARGLARLLNLAAGGALLLRSSMNVPLAQLAGVRGRRGIDVHKTIHVQAPVERVFSLLENYENFPAFMRNVREVRVHDSGRSHWVVAGPAGVPVEWESETTMHRPNEVLAWRTVPGSTVEHAGIIRFRPDERGGTLLDIQMSYNPPAGVVGHVVAKLFGADPKTELDQDLMRMKSFLETGKPPRDAAAHIPAEAVTRLTQPGELH